MPPTSRNQKKENPSREPREDLEDSVQDGTDANAFVLNPSLQAALQAQAANPWAAYGGFFPPMMPMPGFGGFPAPMPMPHMHWGNPTSFYQGDVWICGSCGFKNNHRNQVCGGNGGPEFGCKQQPSFPHQQSFAPPAMAPMYHSMVPDEQAQRRRRREEQKAMGSSYGRRDQWWRKKERVYYEEELEKDGPERVHIMQQIQSNVREMSLDAEGTHIVQTAIRTGTREEHEALAKGVQDHVQELVHSPSSNHVIQKFIESTSAETSDFIALELRKHAADTCNHRFGCRIMCRLLEHNETKPSTQELIAEALQGAADLCRHKFGHYVIQKVIESDPGSPAQRSAVIQALCDDPYKNATDRNAHHVLEFAFASELVTDEDKRKLRHAYNTPACIAEFKKAPGGAGRPAGKILQQLDLS